MIISYSRKPGSLALVILSLFDIDFSLLFGQVVSEAFWNELTDQAGGGITCDIPFTGTC